MSAVDSSWDIFAENEEEDEDDYELIGDTLTNRDAVMFLIEATDKILEPCDSLPDGRCTLYHILDTILSMEKVKIVSSSKDQIGIMLFNTDKTIKAKTNEGWQNTYILQDITQLDVDHIKALTSKLEQSDGQLKETFKPYYGRSVFPQALKGASLLLKSRVSRAASQRIIFITDRENPFPDQLEPQFVEAFKRRAWTSAQDISELNMSIEPLILDYDNKKQFNFDLYLKYTLEKHLDLNDPRLAKSITLTPDHVVKEIRASVRTADGTRRAGFSIPFLLGENLEIGIQGFNLVSVEKRKAYAWYDDDTRDGAMVGVKTLITNPYTNEYLDPKNDLVPYYPVGGKGAGNVKKAVFKPGDLKQIKTFGLSPCLKLLGFKDRDQHKFQNQIKNAYFIYPNEKTYTGSKRTFLALLRSMLKKNKIGVGLFLPRTTSTPQFVHIIPQSEERNEITNRQTKPPGFQLITLPFADDFRPPGIDELLTWITDPERGDGGEDADKVLSKVGQIIKKLTIKDDYEPDRYPNPDLNLHYDLLAAVALEEDEPTPVDTTIPDYDVIKQRAGELTNEFVNLVKDHPNSSLETMSKQNNTSSTATSKKSRPREPEEIDVEEIKSRFQNGTENKLRVADLKAFLQMKGVTPGNMKKQELIDKAKTLL